MQISKKETHPSLRQRSLLQTKSGFSEMEAKGKPSNYADPSSIEYKAPKKKCNYPLNFITHHQLLIITIELARWSIFIITFPSDGRTYCDDSCKPYSSIFLLPQDLLHFVKISNFHLSLPSILKFCWRKRFQVPPPNWATSVPSVS